MLWNSKMLSMKLLAEKADSEAPVIRIFKPSCEFSEEEGSRDAMEEGLPQRTWQAHEKRGDCQEGSQGPEI